MRSEQIPSGFREFRYLLEVTWYPFKETTGHKKRIFLVSKRAVYNLFQCWLNIYILTHNLKVATCDSEKKEQKS